MTRKEAEQDFKKMVSYFKKQGSSRRDYAEGGYRLRPYDGTLCLVPKDRNDSHPYLPAEYYSCPGCGQPYGHHKTLTCLTCEECAKCCNCIEQNKFLKDRFDTWDWCTWKM